MTYPNPTQCKYFQEVHLIRCKQCNHLEATGLLSIFKYVCVVTSCPLKRNEFQRVFPSDNTLKHCLTRSKLQVYSSLKESVCATSKDVYFYTKQSYIRQAATGSNRWTAATQTFCELSSSFSFTCVNERLE